MVPPLSTMPKRVSVAPLCEERSAQDPLIPSLTDISM
jgi:hypothetical protein